MLLGTRIPKPGTRNPEPGTRDFLDGLEAIPLPRLADRRPETIQVRRRAPADVVMLAFGQRQLSAILFTRPRPINHSDVLVRFVDAVDVQKSRRDQGPCAQPGRGRPLPQQLDFEAALFPRFPQGGLLRVFVQLDVAAQRQPLVQRSMVDEQYAALMNHKNGYSEIDLLVNVRHAVGLPPPRADTKAGERHPQPSDDPGPPVSRTGFQPVAGASGPSSLRGQDAREAGWKPVPLRLWGRLSKPRRAV